jgi:hypothetical protein
LDSDWSALGVSRLIFGAEYFDVVVMIEAISHMLRPSDALAESLRVLKPGGVLLISDGNNMRNPVRRRQALRRWAEKEEIRRPVRYQSYRRLREAWLTDHYPGIPGQVAASIAADTPQKLYGDVSRAYEAYLEGSGLPDDRYLLAADNAAVNPGGWTDDALFDPYALSRKLQEMGYDKAFAVPYWGRSTMVRRLLDDALRILPGMMVLARGFRLVATKPTL